MSEQNLKDIAEIYKQICDYVNFKEFFDGCTVQNFLNIDKQLFRRHIAGFRIHEIFRSMQNENV